MKSKTSSAPMCAVCQRNSGVQFAIFNPRFAPFGTVCVACEETIPAHIKNVQEWLGQRAAAAARSGKLNEHLAFCAVAEAAEAAKIALGKIDAFGDGIGDKVSKAELAGVQMALRKTLARLASVQLGAE